MTPLTNPTQDPTGVSLPAATLPASDGPETTLFGEDGFTFGDMVDMVNPLQHIPIVGSIYRNMTEDEISPAPRVVGGTLFGGPIGLVSSLVNLLVENQTGKDVGEHVYALFEDEGEEAPDPDEAMAQNATTEIAAAQIGAGSAYAGVSDWARQEMAHRHEVAALQQKQRAAPLQVADARPASTVRQMPSLTELPPTAPRAEAGLGTKLFVQAMRMQPPEEALALAAQLQQAPQSMPAAAQPAPKPTASAIQPAMTAPPVPSALEAKLQALASRNPWSGAQQDQQNQQEVADSWFAQSMMSGLSKYQGAAGVPR
ncbi:hypothetical protein [Magnetospira sp. QH-2]|uniref:hypothetical protein n=1 Tax=Magnetospira sp. (strain QH-2) TaxID=1288970 RepID=UPI0003E81AF0|nr:hypothetical protein [Magnetospira sp. QH-2]CCQ75597.1 protein of unknown function [Magnetospira sp. QH-2]